MVQVITAVVTDEAREIWPQLLGGLGLYSWKVIDEVRMGEGGWQYNDAGQQVPRTPDSSLTDLDVVVNPGRYPADSLFVVEGSNNADMFLTSADMQFVAPSTLQVNFELQTGSHLSDGFGNDPELWEVGLFTDHPDGSPTKLMVAYGTFQKVTWTAASDVLNTIRITF